MKTTLLTVALLFTLCINGANAQSLTAEDKLNFETRQMATKLGLNEFGFIRLKKLNTEKAIRSQEIITQYAYDATQREIKLAELNKTYDLQLRSFLKPSQLEAYLALNPDLNTLIAEKND